MYPIRHDSARYSEAIVGRRILCQPGPQRGGAGARLTRRLLVHVLSLRCWLSQSSLPEMAAIFGEPRRKGDLVALFRLPFQYVLWDLHGKPWSSERGGFVSLACIEMISA